MSETTNDTTTRSSERTGAADNRMVAVEWIESEFPDWSVQIDETATWEGELRPLWIARRDGHHPQAELTAAKLHSRLSDYVHREQRRNALAN